MPEFTENPPFEITEKYIQPWVAGVQEGGSGIDVGFEYNITEEVNVEFQRVYFRGRSEKVRATGLSTAKILTTFKKGADRPDTVMSSDPEVEASNIPEERMKFDLADNEAVISFIIDNIVLYYKVKDIPEKDLLAYPSNGPKEEQ